MKNLSSQVNKPKDEKHEELKNELASISNMLSESVNGLISQLELERKQLSEEVKDSHIADKTFLKGLSTVLQQTIEGIGALEHSVDLSSLQDHLKGIKDGINELKNKKPEVISPVMNKLETTLSELAKKDFEITVNQEPLKLPEQKPKNAIPVVLVDKTLKNFYDAVSSIVAGGGIQSDLIEAGRVKVDIGELKPGVDYDFIDVQQTSSSIETYVFKLGGSGGSTIRTITVTYVSSTKEDIDTVEFS